MEGGGAGAGGFCANATGPRSPIASASWTKVRMRGFTDLLLGRARQGRKFSAQVSSSQGFRAKVSEAKASEASKSEQRPRGGSRGGSARFAAQFPTSTTPDREQPSSPAVMNSGLARRLFKCRYYVQRLI